MEKRAICISDKVFEISPMSPLALGLDAESLDAKVSQTGDLFGPAKISVFCRAS